MKALDTLNRKQGPNAVFFAATGIEKAWKMSVAKKSPAYTSSWTDLLNIPA
jgi:DNA polymerase V